MSNNFNVVDIAKYFLYKDSNHKIFDKKLTTRNNRTFYEGNARLNKYLHLSQNVYIAKTGTPLFTESLYAYDNGAVSLEVQENYSILLSRPAFPNLPDKVCKFLDKIYIAFQNASLEELIELSHEDEEWVEKSRYYQKSSQKMDSMSRIKEYREQYGDFIKILDGLS